MHHLPIRPSFFVLALAITACNDKTATDAVAPRAPHPSFAVDYAAPPAPSNVSAGAGISTQALTNQQAAVATSWMDNSTYLDEYVTCARFTTLADAAVTTVCTYAADYDQPSGSTGQRSANLVVPAGGPYLMRLSTARWITQPDGWKRSVFSAESAPVTVESALVRSTSTKKNGR